MAKRGAYQICIGKEIRKMRGKTTSNTMAFKMAVNICRKKVKKVHRFHPRYRRKKR
jgi:hypothetical protein